MELISDDDPGQEVLIAKDDPILLALEEAGHAALAEHFDIEVVRVVIRGFGISFTEVNDGPTTLENLHHKLTVALGGYYAVFKRTGHLYIANIYSIDGYCRDDHRMYRLFDEVSLKDHQERKTWAGNAKAAAGWLVEKYWTEIERISEVLNRDREITGVQVRRILGKAQQRDANSCEPIRPTGYPVPQDFIPGRPRK